MRYYSDGVTPAAIGDTVAYGAIGDQRGVSMLKDFIVNLDADGKQQGPDGKLSNGQVVFIGNCKRIGTLQEIC